MRPMDGTLLCDCCGEKPDVMTGLARCHLCGGECCDLCLDDDERHAEDDGERYDDELDHPKET